MALSKALMAYSQYQVIGIQEGGCGSILRGARARATQGVILFSPAPIVGVGVIATVIAVELPAMFMSQSIVRDHNN